MLYLVKTYHEKNNGCTTYVVKIDGEEDNDKSREEVKAKVKASHYYMTGEEVLYICPILLHDETISLVEYHWN